MDRSTEKSAKPRKNGNGGGDLLGSARTRHDARQADQRSRPRPSERAIGPGWVRDALHGVPIGHPVHPPLATVAVGCFVATAILDATKSDPTAARTVLAAGLATRLPDRGGGHHRLVDPPP